MKKFVLCMMLAGLMMPVIAQEKGSFKNAERIHASEMRADLGISNAGILPMNPQGTLVNVDGWTIAGTSLSYDRQTQGNVYPMTQIHDDGFIGATWTNEDNLPFEGSSVPKRGVGYAYSTDGGKTWEGLTLRVGGIPLYWPSYAQWGANGEAILARSANTYEHEGVQILNGLVLLTRENKGTGDWTLRTIPYPAGTPLESNFIMAWSRMTSSGDHHQYLHIFTHTRNDNTSVYYEGYQAPVFYYRTSDGGETWEQLGVLIPEAAGISWHEGSIGGPAYTDNISVASHGNVVAASFIRYGFHDYILKSVDNGDTWEATKFFHSSARYYGTPAEYADTTYTATQGTIAVDNNGKVHVAFGNWMSYNVEEEGTIQPMKGLATGFLSYWNEDMDPLDGDDYLISDVEDLMWDYFFDEALSESGKIYVKSTTPKWPIIGFYVPIENIFTVPDDFEWAVGSYGNAGMFSYPQMAFDENNTLHLAYLGLLDNGADDTRWFRHPYYTTRTEDGTWSQTEYLVNNVDVIDREFAYLTSAGIHNYKMYLMAQVDPYAGTYEAYVNDPSDHNPTVNSYYFFYIDNTAINEVDYTPLTMNVFPNPAEGQATVKFEGKGDITVYNMLGQTVYHVENVENQKQISLNNMTTGVYFVTVRSGNATATQKLIVK